MLRDFLNLLFPQICIQCLQGLVRGEEYLCTTCRISLPRAEMYDIRPNELELRFFGQIRIGTAIPYLKFVKSGSAQQILHALKYRNMPEVGTLLGKWFGSEIKMKLDPPYDLILPVPLHPARRMKRGYNQSDYICQGISEGAGIPWDHSILKRSIPTGTQTKKSRTQRWKNVAGVFEVKNPEKIYSKQILLVDDVVTTGATMISCGDIILQSGASSLSLACLAMAQ